MALESLEPRREDVTGLLSRWRAGDDRALEQLASVVYGELRHMANRYLRQERSGQTLQTYEVRDLIHPIPDFPGKEMNVSPSKSRGSSTSFSARR